MNSPERFLPTALWSVDGIGRRTFRQLVQVLQINQISLEEWWSHPTKYTAIFRLRSDQQKALQAFQTKFTPASYAEYLAAKQIHVVHEWEPHFPANLAILDDRPPVLFVQGDIQFPLQSVGVVGTRKMTSYGQLVTEKIVTELVEGYQTTVVSGFMYGVDAVAHRVAHQRGGHTVAVVGFGFNHLYPAQFARWKEQLLAAGQTFVTEFAPHVRPNKGTFPARNRLIAGLTQGVLVTEAAMQSGSHITAQWAVEYGRCVYAVPGPITNPYTEGTKALLNQGALYVQSAREIAEDLGWEIKRELQLPMKKSLSPLGQALYEKLTHSSQALGTLIKECNQPSGAILAELGYLELAGLICRDSQGWIVKK